MNEDRWNRLGSCPVSVIYGTSMWLSPVGQVNPKAQVSKETGWVPRLCILESFVSELQETDPSDPGRNRREPQERHVKGSKARPDSSQSQAWTPQGGLLLHHGCQQVALF